MIPALSGTPPAGMRVLIAARPADVCRDCGEHELLKFSGLLQRGLERGQIVQMPDDGRVSLGWPRRRTHTRQASALSLSAAVSTISITGECRDFGPDCPARDAPSLLITDQWRRTRSA
jgi:hypothetical protein